METQTKLFPEVQHIPQWLAEHFNNANAGNKALKSFLILCAVYNKQLLRDLAVRYMKEKYQYSLLQSLLSGRFKEEELPF